jgi:hypothetical protein
MTFAAFGPLALGAMALVVALAVLALYLLRRTPRPQMVSSVVFWVRAAQNSRPRVLRAARIPWVSFLVSLLVALAMVGLLGDPRFGSGVRGVTVIVLASGRSMQAEQNGQPRIRSALRQVRRWVERATVGGRVAVVRAGMRPSVLLPLTEEPGDLERALGTFDLDDGPMDLPAALDLADGIVLRSGEAGQILVVADREADHATRTSQVLVPVGAPADSLAITGFSARRDPTAAGEYLVRCEVGSLTSRRASARLRILDGVVPLVDRRVRLGPGRTLAFEAQGFSAARAELTARLSEIELAGARDALALDDVAYATVPPLAPLSVLYVTGGGNPWLDAALAVHPTARVERAAALPDAATLAAYDVVLLDRRPLPVPHPSVVAFRPPAAPMAVSPAAAPRLSAALQSHPVLRGLRLDGVRIRGSDRYQTDPGDQVLLRSGGDALAVARERDERRTVLFGLDLGQTDLVEREAFPLLLHHALRWAAAVRDEVPLPRSLGAPIPAADATLVLGPDGEAVGPSELAAVRQQGLYQVGDRAVAVSGAEHARRLPAGATGGTFRRRDPLPPLAVLVALGLLALMLVEWALLHRGRLS